MKFALLGADDDTLALAEAAVAAGHRLVWIGDCQPYELAAPGRDSLRAPSDEWEDLLDSDLADAVLVGRGAADAAVRSRQVQELVKQGRPVLASFPLFDSVLSYFEVDMARGESGAVVRHYNPVASSGAAGVATDTLREGAELGPVEQVVCERTMADRSRAAVVRQFARDAELLDVIAGGLDRVGAHAAAGAAPDEPSAYAGLSVQLSGRQALPVRWSVSPPHAGPPLRLTLVCALGRLVIDLDQHNEMTAIVRTRNGADAAEAMRPTGAAVRALDEFVAEVASVPHGRSGGSTWPQALHVMELADSIEISLRRGRMIDVQGQQLTEQLAFRGTMAAAGCGLLLVLPPLLLVVGWLAGLAGIDAGRFWAPALLAPPALVFAPQVLPKFVYPPADGDNNNN